MSNLGGGSGLTPYVISNSTTISIRDLPTHTDPAEHLWAVPTLCDWHFRFKASTFLSKVARRPASKLQSAPPPIVPGRLSHGADMLPFQGLLPDGDHAISYTIPNLLVDHAMRNPPVPPGFWRGVNINQNANYVECFLAHMATEAREAMSAEDLTAVADRGYFNGVEIGAFQKTGIRPLVPNPTPQRIARRVSSPRTTFVMNQRRTSTAVLLGKR